MARLKAIDSDGSMFKEERAALLHVAFETGFLVAEYRFSHSRTRRHAPGRREGSMWIMTIGATHEAFVDAVFRRHGELRANRCVA